MARQTVAVSILADASGVNKGTAQAEGRLKSFAGKAGKLVAFGAAAVATGSAILIGSSVKAASDAQQSLGATESVFGKYADKVVAKSNQAANAVGLSANEYRELNNVTGAMLKSSGTPLSKIAGLTDKLTGRAADLAATFGGSTADAVSAVSSLLRGEADPIERYGVSIKQSDVNARLAADGLGELTGEAKKQAEAQARLTLLYEQSASAQGQFARENNTLAGQQQRASAGFENLKTTIGTAFLPTLTSATGVLNTSLLPAMQNLAEKYAPLLAARLDTLVQKIGPLVDGGFAQFGDTLRNLGKGDSGASLSSIGDSLSRLAPLIKDAAAGLPSFTDVLSVGSTVLKFAADNTDLLAKALPFLVAGYVAVKVAGVAANAVQVLSLPTKIAEVVVNRQLVASNRALIASRTGNTVATAAGTTVENVGIVTRARSLVGMVAQRAAMIAGAAATGLLTVAQGALNIVLTANPIGLLVVGIAALVAGLIIAYKKSDTFRGIVKGAFGAVAAAGRAVAGVVTGAIGKMSGVIGVAGRLIKVYLLPITVGFRLISAGARTMATLVPRLIGRVTGAVSGIGGRVIAAVSGFGGLLYGAGSRLIGGLISGITSKISAVTGAIGNVASKVRGFFPGSPIKEGPLTGWNNGGAGKRLIDQGLIAGIRARTNRVRTIIGATSSAVADGLRTAPISAARLTSSAVAGARGTITNIYNVVVRLDNNMTEAQMGAAIHRAVAAAKREGLVPVV